MNRNSVLSQSSARSDADYTSPAWSADGTALAWSKNGDFEEIQTWIDREGDTKPTTLGLGTNPVWMDGSVGVIALVDSPNGNDLVVYSDDPTRLLIPPLHLQQEVNSLIWISGSAVPHVEDYLADNPIAGSEALWQQQISTQDTTSWSL